MAIDLGVSMSLSNPASANQIHYLQTAYCDPVSERG